MGQVTIVEALESFKRITIGKKGECRLAFSRSGKLRIFSGRESYLGAKIRQNGRGALRVLSMKASC